MANLISNGSRLYRYNKALLRTPILMNLALAPDEQAQYDIAGAFNQQIPTRGFVLAPNYTQVDTAGKYMRQTYLGMKEALGPIIWRNNSAWPQYDPGFIFYQGSYSPSTAQPMPEAYMTMPAYHFTIPSKYDQFEVVDASLNIMHGGAIFQYQSAMVRYTGSDANKYPVFARDAATWLLPSDSYWRGSFPTRTGFFSDLYHPYDMYHDATDEFYAEMNNTQGYLNEGAANCKQYWVSWPSGNVNYADGHIPITTHPWVQSIPLSQAMCADISNMRSGWIPSLIEVDATTGDESNPYIDYPYWTGGNDSKTAMFWLCANWYGFSLHLTLALI